MRRGLNSNCLVMKFTTRIITLLVKKMLCSKLQRATPSRSVSDALGARSEARNASSSASIPSCVSRAALDLGRVVSGRERPFLPALQHRFYLSSDFVPTTSATPPRSASDGGRQGTRRAPLRNRFRPAPHWSWGVEFQGYRGTSLIRNSTLYPGPP